jgi:hypothetical protein
MADTWAILEFVIDQELASVKRSLMDSARHMAVMGGTREGTDLMVTIGVDLDGVLKASCTVSEINQVARQEASDSTPSPSSGEQTKPTPIPRAKKSAKPRSTTGSTRASSSASKSPPSSE